MSETEASPNTDDDARLRADSRSRAGTPRWVKVFGIITIIVAVLFVVLLVVGGPHNPGRHGGLGGATSVGTRA